MGFMGYVGERLAVGLEGLAWPVAYVALLVIYVLRHFGFVRSSVATPLLFVELWLKYPLPR